MKQPVRYFAIGLLVSSILFLIFNIMFDTPKVEKQENVSLTTEEMITAIEKDGYKVISREEYITFALLSEQTDENVDQADSENEKDKNEANSQEKADEKADNEEVESQPEEKQEEQQKPTDDVITFTFETKDGVVTQHVADLLVENKIIDDRWGFLEYMEETGKMYYIQLGTFTVSSDMTFEEIANIITKPPGR